MFIPQSRFDDGTDMSSRNINTVNTVILSCEMPQTIEDLIYIAVEA
jgi:hypothetical protein